MALRPERNFYSTVQSICLFFLFKVKPIKLSKAGIPLGVFSQGDSSKTVKATEDMHAEETQTHVPRNTTRNRDETKEEKKHRKQEIKNDRKVSLVEAQHSLVFFGGLTWSYTPHVTHSSQNVSLSPFLGKLKRNVCSRRLQNTENSTRVNLSVFVVVVVAGETNGKESQQDRLQI